MHHIPLYKCWNWGSNRLTAKLSVGPGFILSFTAYDLDTGAWVPPAWWKHIQVKRQLQWCDGNLDCMVCILSPGPRACSCIPLGSPSQCEYAHPSPALAHTEKLPRANCRKKDYFPQKLQTEKKLAETWAKSRVGRWQKRIKLKPEAFWLLSILPSFLSCSF